MKTAMKKGPNAGPQNDVLSDSEYKGNQNFNGSNIFQRCPHDKENPYSMVSNALIRDILISPECRWLIIYLLSNREGWKIKISQIVSHVKKHMGRDKVYQVVNEAIEAGYIKREKYKRGNLEYIHYFVSENPKFKKCFRHPEIQEIDPDPESTEEFKKCFRHPESPDTENTHHKERLSGKNKQEEKTSEPAARLSLILFETIKKLSPKTSKPNLHSWSKQMDIMMRVDGHSEEDIHKVIEFILYQHENSTGDFKWSMAVRSPEKLRKHFAKIWDSMVSDSIKKDKKNPVDTKMKIINENKIWCADLRKKTKTPTNIIFKSEENYVVLGNFHTQSRDVLGYGENGFKEIVKNFLRKNRVLL